MNWDSIAAIGELVGATAVVVSLIYLSSQIRLNNKLMKLEAHRFAFTSFIPLTDLVLADENLLRIMNQERDTLTELELARVMVLGRRAIHACRQAWYNMDTLDSIAGTIGSYKAIYHRPTDNYGMPDAWPSFRNGVEKEFAEWFDKNIVAE